MQGSIPAGEIIDDGTDGDAGESVNPFTVLVIDGSKTIRQTIKALLETEGYQAISAADGFEALGMIADDQPDLIFMDIRMPRLDGYQTCALIKQQSGSRHTPVIMFSSEGNPFEPVRGKVVGCVHSIEKPFSREDLLNAIEQYADQDGYLVAST